MRKIVFVLTGIAISALAADANAAVRSFWDQESGKWVKYDTDAKRVVPKSYSPIKRTVITYDGPFSKNTIVVDTSERRLYYVLGNGKALRYGVGVGKEGFQWSGADWISRKAEWPGWTPPPEMIAREKKKGRVLPAYMEGGPGNPLGARALYIGGTLYRIHGSNEPWTIGNAVSSGCIRLTNDDVTHLYEQVRVGSRVVVLTGKESKAQLYALANPPPPVKKEVTVDVAEGTPDSMTKDDAVVVLAPAGTVEQESEITGSVVSKSRGKDDDVLAKAPTAAPAEKAVDPAEQRTKDDDVVSPIVEAEDVTVVVDEEPALAAN